METEGAQLTNPTAKGDRYNQGKPRLDLIPFPDANIRDTAVPVEEAYAYLKMWMYAKPMACELWLPRGELIGVAEVLAFGTAKYAPRGWEKGLSFSDTFASAARHAEALARGELLDTESRLPHQSHFWCNAMFLIVFTERGRATALDDRPPALADVVEKFDRIKALLSLISGGVRLPTVNPAGGN